MAQWQDQTFYEILLDKGYDWSFIHTIAGLYGYGIFIADPVPAYDWNTAERAEEVERTFYDHNKIALEMAKQHALTLMPKFD